MQVLYPTDIREEEIKLRVAKDFFSVYDTTRIIGSIDFCVARPTGNAENSPSKLEGAGGRVSNKTISLQEIDSLVWGEAKQGTSHDIYHSFVQLILTIGKARTFDKNLPPQYLAAFDAARFAFIPYHAVQDVFYQNDFNWNVTPSDHQSKEFLQLYALVEKTLHDNAFVYNYVDDEKALRRFIKQNLVLGSRKTKRHKVNKNNFTFVYQRWCEEVKGSIQIDWEKVKKVGLLDADFFLADLLSKDGNYLLDNLFVLLKHDHYQFDRKLDEFDLWGSKEARFKDDMQAHIAFWNKYERPPKREYWGYIVERRDLLVPQDVRERKGSFFTPRQWVELSQQYLADTLGEDWQDNYYIWDCCAGTGNLLNGLTNPRRIWASTLDKADVDVIHERIKNGAGLLDHHVFQFDFLNDDFSRLPQELQDIINDKEKCKRLVIYINPPYAEAGTATQVTGRGANKTGVSNGTMIWRQYKDRFGLGIRELYVQFFIRVYAEIHGATLAEFSTLKILQGSAFSDFRDFFQARLLRSFAVPANTFDNVKGQFPIGFFIWNTADYTDSIGIPKGYDEGTQPSSVAAHSALGDECVPTTPLPMRYGCATYGVMDVYDRTGEKIGEKTLYRPDNDRPITQWISAFGVKETKDVIGYTGNTGPDFQHNQYLYIASEQGLLKTGRPNNETKYAITKRNLIPISIYFSARLCQDATWLNDRDQFLYPKDGWQDDTEFQLNSLVYTLFHNQNRITINTANANAWIPFYEDEIGQKIPMRSHFMQEYLHDFLKRKIVVTESLPSQADLFTPASEAQECHTTTNKPALQFSPEAQAVMDAGREIWRYYVKNWQERGGGSPDASLYDIKEYFKGRKDNGNMNATSDDEHFNGLMENLRVAMQGLAKRIEPKVYEYGFLK